MSEVAAEASAIEVLAKSNLREACDRARRLVADHPYDEAAAKLLTDVVGRFAGDPPPAVDRLAGFPTELREASNLLSIEEDEQAEILLRAYLSRYPRDVLAMSMMAEIAARCDLFEQAQKILARAREIDPRSVDVMLTLAKLLNHLSFLEHGEDRGREALAILDEALILEPDNVKIVSLYASILVRFRRLDESVPYYHRLLDLDPMHWLAWTNFGMMLNSLGRFGEAVAALRTATAINFRGGTAWWELANLKIFRFFASDIERMREALADATLDDLPRSEIHFALASALDGLGELAEASEHLRLGNAIKQQLEPHDPIQLSKDVSDSIATFDRAYFAARATFGDSRPDPIFIVGLQRSGTTLVEQILSTHSAIEGTEELFVLLQIALEVSARDPAAPWQQCLSRRPLEELATMGAGYLHLAQHYRVSKAPHFIDKNPTNWRFVGLILSILPNARIIDVRRNPMDCCYANWTQNYQRGLGFAYSLDHLGRYYTDYLRLMRHFDEVAPGRVHRLIYDDLVDDFEPNVRRMFDYLQLPFEPSALRFHEAERVVLTPSSQQVRQPINRSGMDRWKRYEPYLDELRDSLGDSRTNWRS